MAAHAPGWHNPSASRDHYRATTTLPGATAAQRCGVVLATGACDPMSGRILVLNSGSSSIKFALFTAARDPVRVLHGAISGIGAAPVFRAYGEDAAPLFEDDFHAPGGTGPLTHEAAQARLPDRLAARGYASRLLGASGVSGDMRELLASSDPRSKEAVNLFVYRAARELGSLVAVLGGLDVLVFTAGIGERAAAMRAMICERARWLGVELDEEANRAHRVIISASASRAAVCVIPTDEEMVIARHAFRVLGCGS
jgi:acetate kinase